MKFVLVFTISRFLIFKLDPNLFSMDTGISKIEQVGDLESRYQKSFEKN